MFGKIFKKIIDMNVTQKFLYFMKNLINLYYLHFLIQISLNIKKK